MISNDMPTVARGQVIVTPDGDIHGDDTPGSRDLARRIKACINACSGISTAELEAGIIQDMARVLSQVAPILEAQVRNHQAGEKAA